VPLIGAELSVLRDHGNSDILWPSLPGERRRQSRPTQHTTIGMSTRIGINGFDRTGRAVFRSAHEQGARRGAASPLITGGRP
jgi:hypothetical protein